MRELTFQMKFSPRKNDTIKNTIWMMVGGCMVGWANFGVTHSIFLPPKHGSNHYIFLNIMELL